MLFEKLSDREKSMIERYILYYGTNPDHDNPSVNTRASLNHILQYWDSAKENLYHLLGDNLMISRHFEFDTDITRITRNLEEMAESRKTIHGITYEKMFQRFYNWVHRISYKHWDYTRALYKVHEGEELYTARRIVSIDDDWFYFEDLARNTYDGENVLLMLPDNDKPYQVKNGMRLTRLIERLRKAYGDDEWTEEDMARLNDLIAIARTSSNSSFDLYLSIHPLDYMTMSDNDMRWDSCMAWKDHTGDFRQGTVECMNSSTVVVAYIREKHDMNLGFSIDNQSATWTNKSWRQLFLVTPETIVAVKGYPYQYDKAVDAVLTWLKDLAKTNWGVEYPFDGTISENDGALFDQHHNEVVFNDKLMYINARWGYMYDDIGTLREHRVLANLDEMAEVAKYTDDHTGYYQYYIAASGVSECMWCGNEITDDDGNGDDGPQNLVYCSQCSSAECRTCCDCCGEYVSHVTWVEGLDTYLCDDCYDNEIFQDDINGEWDWNENMKKIYLAVGVDKSKNAYQVLPEPIYVSICGTYDSYDLKRIFTHPNDIQTCVAPVSNLRRNRWESMSITMQNIVFPNDLTSRGLDMFLCHGPYVTIGAAIDDMNAVPLDDNYIDSLNRSKSDRKDVSIGLDLNDLTHYFKD